MARSEARDEDDADAARDAGVVGSTIKYQGNVRGAVGVGAGRDGVTLLSLSVVEDRTQSAASAAAAVVVPAVMALVV